MGSGRVSADTLRLAIPAGFRHIGGGSRTSPMPAIPFRKMNGLGNEFIVFDARRAPVRIAPAAIRTLGGESGIGFDQMITIERSPKGAEAFMRIHNRDG